MSCAEGRADVAFVEASVGVGRGGLASTLGNGGAVPFVPQLVERSGGSWRRLDGTQQVL